MCLLIWKTSTWLYPQKKKKEKRVYVSTACYLYLLCERYKNLLSPSILWMFLIFTKYLLLTHESTS